MKIIDITGGGSFSSEEVKELREATQKEVDILHKVSGHPNISKWQQGTHVRPWVHTIWVYTVP